MTDQTPDPFEQFHTEECAGNFLTIDGYTQRCDCGLDAALAAERAQHQQEIEKRAGDFEAVLAAVDAERNDWRDEVAQRDETIRQLQDAFARCQEVQQATAETWRIEHDQMAEQIRLLRGAMAADDERLRRAAEQAGILYVSCDTAEALAEQITRLSAQVQDHELTNNRLRLSWREDVSEARAQLLTQLDAIYLKVNCLGGAPFDGPYNTAIGDVLTVLRSMGAIDAETERRS